MYIQEFPGFTHIYLIFNAIQQFNYFRNVVLAAIAGLFVVMLIYIFTNISYFVVLSKEEFSSSGAVAVVCIMLITIDLSI